MSTSEYRSVDAEGDLPISAAELAALASQLFAAEHPAGTRQSAADRPAGPARQRARHHRGDVGGRDGRWARRIRSRRPRRSCRCLRRLRCRRRLRLGRKLFRRRPCRWRRAAMRRTRRRPRRRTCRRGALTRAPPGSDFGVRGAHRASCRPFPACWPAHRRPLPVAPRGSAPGWPPAAPSVADLGWSGTPPAAPAGDEANYYFLTDRSDRRTPRAPAPGRPRGFRRQRDARRLPDPARDGQRQAADLVRQRRDHAEAAGGDRPAVVLLRARELQHPPRRARAGGAGHRRLRRRPRHRAAVHRRVQERSRSSSCAAPPRPSTWWPTRGAASTSGPATRSSSPISSTTRTSFRGSYFRSGPARCSRSRRSTTRATCC